jgi:hypothetical protein
MQLDFIGEIAKAIPAVVGQFNTKAQANNLAVAEANAREAEANSKSADAKPKSNTIIWIGVIIAVLAIAYFLTKAK